jgi:hypothetical protein
VSAREVFYDQWQSFLRDLQQHEKALTVEVTREQMVRAAAKQKEHLATMDIRGQLSAKADRIMSKSFSGLQAKLDAILNDTHSGS